MTTDRIWTEGYLAQTWGKTANSCTKYPKDSPESARWMAGHAGAIAQKKSTERRLALKAAS